MELLGQFLKQGRYKACLLYQNKKEASGRGQPPGHFENKDSKWCFLTVFETIWNYRDYSKNKYGEGCILTAFETAENNLKTRTLNGAF